MWFARDTGERHSRHGDIYKIQNTVCFRFTFSVCHMLHIYGHIILHRTMLIVTIDC